MGKLIIVSIFSLMAYALVPENFLKIDTLYFEQIFLNEKLSDKNFKFNDSIDHFELIKDDPLQRIHKDFKIPDFFYQRVKFWFKIYTRYNSSQTLIHDKENLAIIYDSLNFEELKGAELNIYSKSLMQTQLTSERVSRIKKSLTLMAIGKEDELSSKVFKALQKAKVKVPENLALKKQFYFDLADNLRIQTGQKNFIRRGLKNIKPYKGAIENYFQIFNLPIELLSIPFLESSFNPQAESKVSASGVWQFMPLIGKHFMKIDKNQDGRSNPLVATLGALHLLKQNFKILKRWDLAVTAYNSGTKHILKAKKKIKKSKMSLADFIKYYNHPHIGFASENFYSEFLALVYTLAYREKIFEENLESPLKIDEKNVKAYLNLCSFRPNKFFKKFKDQSPDLYYLNLHFEKSSLEKNFSKGELIFSDVPLSKKEFWEIPLKLLKTLFPKNYKKLILKKKCL